MMNEVFTGTDVRKLRIGVMGEFSAGKSTLCNLLLGERALTERVTATRLSPVWIAQGAPRVERELIGGQRLELSPEELATVPIEGTRSIRLYAESDGLEMFDLIDFPGISDPNMPSEVWERLLPEIDAIIWCTHANQAWRQSEAEVWRSIPQEVKERSLLLVTRFDTILGERDRARLLARVRHETAGQFSGIFPISLTQAIAGADNLEAWEASGAEPFTAHLIDMMTNLQTDLRLGRIVERAPYVEEAPVPDVFDLPDAAPVVSSPSALDPFEDAFQEPSIMAEVRAARDAERPSFEGMPDLPDNDWMHTPHDSDRDQLVEIAAAPQAPAPEAPVTEAAVSVPQAPQRPVRRPLRPAADETEAAAPPPRSPISLLSRRSAAAATPDTVPGVLPRRVAPTGSRRTERPGGEAGVQSLRIDALKEEVAKATASPATLREAMSRR